MAADERYVEVKDEKDSESVTLDSQSTSELPSTETSDYSYGFNQEPLERQAVRGLSGASSSRFFYNVSHATGGGTITVTGCPFTPTYVSVNGSFSDVGGVAFCYGSATGVSDQGYVSVGSNANSEQGSGTYIATLRNSSGTSVKRLSFSSFTSDGVVLTAPVSAATTHFRIELSR